jgi:hypothetical protein
MEREAPEILFTALGQRDCILLNGTQQQCLMYKKHIYNSQFPLFTVSNKNNLSFATWKWLDQQFICENIGFEYASRDLVGCDTV